MAFPAPLTIVALSSLVVLLIEVLSLLFISNTSGYKRVVADIDRTSKELERLASAGASSATAVQKKRERALEVQLTYLSRDFFFYRMQQGLIMSGLLGTMFYVLKTWYLGRPVAQLPFVPMFPFSKLAHQWLDKPAAMDCSFMFLYVICNLGIRPNIAKLMGTQLPPNVQKATEMQSMTARFARLTTGRGL